MGMARFGIASHKTLPEALASPECLAVIAWGIAQVLTRIPYLEDDPVVSPVAPPYIPNVVRHRHQVATLSFFRQMVQALGKVKCRRRKKKEKRQKQVILLYRTKHDPPRGRTWNLLITQS